jgi:hypothetical protein
VCTTAIPGEKASDHFTPLEAVNASGLVMFSIRIVNFVASSPWTMRPPAIVEIAAAAINNLPNTLVPSLFTLSSFVGERILKAVLAGLDATGELKDAGVVAGVHEN